MVLTIENIWRVWEAKGEEIPPTRWGRWWGFDYLRPHEGEAMGTGT